MKIIAAILLLSVMPAAHAWDCQVGINTKPCIVKPPPTDPTVTALSNAQTQAQSQQEQQQQKQDQTQTAVGTSSNTNSVGNVSGVGNTEISYPKQAPSVAQGSFAIMGCSAAGNAGGSNTHGSAFLGFGWTPHDCYLFYQASAYQAIGQNEAACNVLNHTHAMEKLHKDEGVPLANCTPPPVVVVPPPVTTIVPCKDCVTHEELNRVVEHGLAK